MKITAFNDEHNINLGTGSTTIGSGAPGGDLFGTLPDVDVIGLRGQVALGSNLLPVGVGDVLTIIQASPAVAIFATSSNSAVSYGSNSTRVAETPSAGAGTEVARATHVHDGIATVTASSSNTLQRGTVNLRAGTNIALALSDTDGEGEFDTITIHSLAAGGGGGVSLSNATPIVESGSGSAGTGTAASRDDHVHPADAGGGSVAFPFDEAPASPHASDDEFPGTSLDAQWTNPITSAANCDLTLSVADGWLYFEPATTGTASTGKRGAFGIRQPSPSGSFTISAKIVDLRTGDDARAGIWVAKTGGKAYIIGSQRNSTRIANLNGITTYSESAEWSAYDGSLDQQGPGAWLGYIWFKLVYDAGASTLTGYYSANGVFWSQIGSAVTSVTQPDRMGIAVWANTANVFADHAMGCDWFRVTEP